MRDGRYARGESRTLGALALTERFVRQDPPSHREIEVLRAEIDAQLSHHPLYCAEPWRTPDRLGATTRNLAKIEIACHECPLNTLHGFVLTRGSVEASVQLFRENPLAKRREIAGLSRDRGDIILAGALTVLGVLDRLGIDSLTSPRRACARVCSSSTSGMTCPIR